MDLLIGFCTYICYEWVLVFEWRSSALLFMWLWFRSTVSLVTPPNLSLFVFLPIHPAPYWRHTTKTILQMFHISLSYYYYYLFIFYFFSFCQCVDKQPSLLPGISLLPLPAPPSRSSALFALICPGCSSVTGSSGLSRSTIVVGAINTLAPTRFEVKAWLQSIHYQINNIVLSRQPGNHQAGGIPAFCC